MLNIRKIERKRRERIKKKAIQRNKTVSNFRHKRDKTRTAKNNSKTLKANKSFSHILRKDIKEII